MKLVKILIGLFLFALTYYAFKDGIDPNENIFYYLPITVAFFIGLFLIISALSPKEKEPIIKEPIK